MALQPRTNDEMRDEPESAHHTMLLAVQDRARDFMRDLQARDWGKLRHWFTAQSQVWVPPAQRVVGVGRILALFRSIFRRYAELEWEVTRFYPVSSSTIIYETLSWGSLKGHDGNTPYRNSIITVLEFDLEGKIKSLSDYFKDTAVFQCPHA
jgi:limonene-1,2-epoxide hydrolase